MILYEKDSVYEDVIPIFFYVQKFLGKIEGNPRTTVSQDVQTRFPVQLAFAKFLSKIKGNF